MDKPFAVTALGESTQVREDRVAVEEPLEIRLGHGPRERRMRTRLTATLRTPGHDEDLTLGLLHSEGVVRELAEVIGFERGDEENILRVDLAPGVAIDADRLARTFASTGSCGLCGKTILDGLEAACEPVRSGLHVPPDLLLELPRRLREAQTHFESTGSLHAAGLFDREGRLIAIREDVGRHNAVDKVLGAHWTAGERFEDRVLVLSGRAGFELIQKAARFGVPVVVAIGAPTSLAVELAERMHVTLLGFVRDGRGNCYTHPERIAI